MSREPRWLSRAVVEAMHAELLRLHGGLPGLRDANGLESALAWPRQRWAYEPDSDLSALAAAYGFGLARNYAFLDGDKRVSLMAIYTFCGRNGQRLVAPEVEAVQVILDVAAGELGVAELAAWIRRSLTPAGEGGGG